MRHTLILAFTLLIASLPAIVQADDTKVIATLCKSQWPGDRGIQSFCIREQRNYRDWLQYTRKRVYRHATALKKIDQCIAARRPDYRKAFDCYWNTDPFVSNK